MEKEKSLETRALISKLPDSVKDKIYNFLANGVVTFLIEMTLVKY